MPETIELSEREQDVLLLVATGASNKEIAQKLYISANTVKVHLRNIYAKIGVTSRTEAAMYAVNKGYVASPGGVGGREELGSEAGEAHSDDVDVGVKRPPLGITRSLWGLIIFILVVVIGIAAYLIIDNTTGVTETFSSPADIPRWQLMAEMPTPRFGLAVTTIGTELYAFGGETEKGITGIVERYDPEANAWVALTTKPIPVVDAGAVVIGGKVYIPGGRTVDGRVTDVMEIYDPRTDEWSFGANLLKGVSAYGLIDFEGKIYLFGGWDGQKFVSQVYEYDPGLDAWREIEAMPTARGYVGAVSSGDRVYVLGGTDGEQLFDVNEVFVPALANGQNDPWSTATALPEGLYGMGATSIADIVYVIGGKSAQSREFNSLAFFPGEDEWRAVEDPQEAAGVHLGAVTLGTQLYIIGGELNSVPRGHNQLYQAIYTVSIPVIVK